MGFLDRTFSGDTDGLLRYEFPKLKDLQPPGSTLRTVTLGRNTGTRVRGLDTSLLPYLFVPGVGPGARYPGVEQGRRTGLEDGSSDRCGWGTRTGLPVSPTDKVPGPGAQTSGLEVPSSPGCRAGREAQGTSSGPKDRDRLALISLNHP